MMKEDFISLIRIVLERLILHWKSSLIALCILFGVLMLKAGKFTVTDFNLYTGSIAVLIGLFKTDHDL